MTYYIYTVHVYTCTCTMYTYIHYNSIVTIYEHSPYQWNLDWLDFLTGPLQPQ